MRNVENKPYLQRRIKRKGPIFLKGYFPSKKNVKALYFESYMELAALLHFEHDPNIIFIDSQPHSIEYWLGRKRLTYTPDLLVVTATQTRKYIEVKPKDKLDTTDNETKFNALKATYQKLNREFETFDEENVPRTRLKNLELLFNGAKGYQEKESEISAAISAIKCGTSVGQAYNVLSEQNISTNLLHFLLFNQYFVVALDEPITNDSLLTLNVYDLGVH